MPKKNKNKNKIQVVDYRSVNLAWLVDFKDKFVSKELAPKTTLVVAKFDSLCGNFHKNETLHIIGRTATNYVVSRPYGETREGEIAQSSVLPKQRTDWTTEDVAEYVIKAACIEQECTYLERIEPESAVAVSRREYQGAFVSQARKCKFGNLVGALLHFYTLKNADISKQYVWLDIFSVNQPKLTARDIKPAVRIENERQLTEGLHVAIANFDQRILFIDKWDEAMALTRAWCVWEIFGVAKAKRQLEVALPESEYDKFVLTMRSSLDKVVNKLGAVDVERAQCFNPEDLKTIHQAIRDEASFEILNDIVKTQLRAWVVATAKAQLDLEEQKSNPNRTEIVVLASSTGMMYLSQGHAKTAEELLRKALRVATELAKDRDTDALVAVQLNSLAVLLQDQGKLDEAKPMFEEAIAICRRLGNEQLFALALFLCNLAKLLVSQGTFDKAKLMYDESLGILDVPGWKNTTFYAAVLSNIADLLIVQGKLDEAKPLCDTVIAIWQQVDPNQVATGLISFASLLKAQGQLDEAKLRLEQALRIRRRVYGNLSLRVAKPLYKLAQLLREQDVDSKEAERLGKEAYKIASTVLGSDAPIAKEYRRAFG